MPKSAVRVREASKEKIEIASFGYKRGDRLPMLLAVNRMTLTNFFFVLLLRFDSRSPQPIVPIVKINV